MINWMQKHKKSLIPTVWISTIAFVGAGFVGWGAYDLNKSRSTSVAKVGDTAISIKEFQNKYSEVYNYLKSISDGKFTDEQAKKMHLDEMAINALIQDAILLNFAKDLGINASDEEVAREIVNSDNFKTDGKFSKKLYENAMKNAGLSQNEYEKELKKVIILDKLKKAISIKPNADDIEMLAASEFMQDKVEIAIVDQNVSTITFNDDELKDFWEKNKSKYLTQKTYEMDAYFVEPENKNVDEKTLREFFEKNRDLYRNENDKLMSFEEANASVLNDYLADFNKDEAIKKYLDVKKGKIFTNEKLVLNDNDEIIKNLQNMKIGEFNKPVKYKNGNLITKLTKINEPQIMEFDAAKKLAGNDLFEAKKAEDLKNLAENSLGKVTMKDIGFVSKASENTTNGILSDEEFAKFITLLFTSDKQDGYVLYDNKALIYKITSQTLDNPMSANYISALESSLSKLINTKLQEDLISVLQKRYEIQRYYKGGGVE